jgi:hypothetical protein
MVLPLSVELAITVKPFEQRELHGTVTICPETAERCARFCSLRAGTPCVRANCARHQRHCTTE